MNDLIEPVGSSDPEHVRQSERTIDNLKRLYAVLFAISFTVAATKTFEKLSQFADPDLPHDLRYTFANFEITFAFIITAGLFYYQGDKYLDVNYARSPIPRAGKLTFAIDYMVNVLTMMPFFLMAQSLDGHLIARFGFLWFFVSYFILILLGLSLMVAREFIDMVSKRTIEPSVNALRCFWMTMNSLMLMVAAVIYFGFQQVTPCPVKAMGTEVPWAVLWIGVVILCRDGLDFSHAWAILFPLEKDRVEQEKMPIIRVLQMRSAGFTRTIGLLSVAALAFVIFKTRLWDVAHLAATCSAAR